MNTANDRLLIGMPIQKITATSLAAVTIASSVGALSYYQQGFADVSSAAMLATTSVFSSMIGGKYSKKGRVFYFPYSIEYLMPRLTLSLSIYIYIYI